LNNAATRSLSATLRADSFNIEGTQVGDQVGMVRYRSRWDILKMAVEIAGKRVDLHKWASLEKTQVFPVKPFFNLTFLRTTVAILLLGLGTLLPFLLMGFLELF
jgi:hypothetical protein